MENNVIPNHDFELIQEVRTGKKEVYAELIRRYHSKVLGHCMSMLQNHVEAEEAAQDIFVKTYLSLEKFRGTSSFSTWLYRIAANHCLDLLRKRTRSKTYSLEALVESEGNSIYRFFATPAVADSRMEANELVEKILSTLPDDYRVILTLRESDGLDYKQIAEILNCSLASVKHRLCRARKQLHGNFRNFLDKN